MIRRMALASLLLSGCREERHVIQELEPPAQLSITSVPSGVKLSWAPVAGAESYRVYVGEDRVPTLADGYWPVADETQFVWVTTPGVVTSMFVTSRAGGRSSAASPVLQAVALPLARFDDAPSWVVTTSYAAAAMGSGLAIGDVNGDGYGDLAIGSRTSSIGFADLYLGGPSGPAASPVWHVNDDIAGTNFGRSLTIGDVTGDGYGDLLVGMPQDAAGTGRARIFLGGPLGLPDVAAWDEPGPAAAVDFGRDLAVVGDLDDDGFAEFAIAQGADSRVDVFRGGGAPAVAPGWSLYGETSDNGIPLAAGDVNGDGRPDLLIGHPNEDLASNNDSGEAVLYLGAAGGYAEPPDWNFPGETAGIYFGSAVAMADLDGNGFDDLMVGAPKASPGGELQAGEVLVFLASSAGTPAPAPSLRIEGYLPTAEEGRRLVALADPTLGPAHDLASGLPFWDPAPGQDRGRVHVYFGDPLDSTEDDVLEGEEDLDLFGAVLAGGDLDGDGIDDLAVAAIGADGGRGKVHVFRSRRRAGPQVSAGGLIAGSDYYDLRPTGASFFDPVLRRRHTCVWTWTGGAPGEQKTIEDCTPENVGNVFLEFREAGTQVVRLRVTADDGRYAESVTLAKILCGSC